MKTLKIICKERLDNYGYPDAQLIDYQTKEGTFINYFVYNLDPEDAILGRELFPAESFVDTLRLGMQLSKEGYDSIDFETVTVENFEEDC